MALTIPGLQAGPLQAAHGLIPGPPLPGPPAPPPGAAGPPPPGAPGDNANALVGGGSPPVVGGGDDGGQAALILRAMINLAHKFIAVEPDAVDKQTMAKVMMTLTGYLAKEQKDKEAAMGSSPAMRFIQKAG